MLYTSITNYFTNFRIYINFIVIWLRIIQFHRQLKKVLIYRKTFILHYLIGKNTFFLVIEFILVGNKLISFMSRCCFCQSFSLVTKEYHSASNGKNILCHSKKGFEIHCMKILCSSTFS